MYLIKILIIEHLIKIGNTTKISTDKYHLRKGKA
jgi:hypothetical protein